MYLFRSCLEAGSIVSSNFEENAILSGASDTIIVKQKDGKFKSTPFLICFGPFKPIHSSSCVSITINNSYISDVKFGLDHKGYIQPPYLSDK